MTLAGIVEIVDFLAGIGTFISSIIALYALKEVMKQRRAMYQPKLYFSEFALDVKGNVHRDNQHYSFHLNNLYEPVDKSNDIFNPISAQFFFENIGYGVASNVQYTWTFDYRKAINMLCELNEDLSYIDDLDLQIKSAVLVKQLF